MYSHPLNRRREKYLLRGGVTRDIVGGLSGGVAFRGRKTEENGKVNNKKDEGLEIYRLKNLQAPSKAKGTQTKKVTITKELTYPVQKIG